MRKGIISAIALLSVCVVTQICAQTTINIPYSFSFEKSGADSLECLDWVFDNPANAATDSVDAWYIGEAAFSEGLRSLYISCDSGHTSTYCRKRSVVVAYRKMLIPQGAYIFTFDWQNNASRNSGLYVCLVPGAGAPPKSNFTSSKEPNWVKNSKYRLTTAKGTTDCLRGAMEWENASFQENFNKPTSVYLTFVWINDELDSVPFPFAACIDNLQITSANCRRPENLNVLAGCDTVTVTWEGSAEKYILEYRENGTNKWHTVNDIRSKSYMLTGMNEGVYDFRVRGVCNDTELSACETKNGVIVFCPDNHCINYVDLNNENVQCYNGIAGENNFWPLSSPVDDGPNSITSRHTVYWIRNQYDPRTNFKLKTIPDEELASVRLGNWRNGGEAERIVYKYTVDNVTAPVLILKYAVVFELPDHEKWLQPYFDLTIFDESGQVLGGDLLCGKAEFYAGYGDPEVWHEEKIGKTKISWKDWTTLGVNLAGYEGQTLSIQLTTQDCVPQAHFGYAYFTLGCVDGTIQSVSCGASEYMDIEAPLGFDYVWFTQYDNDGNPLDCKGTDRTHRVPASDKTPYHCRCSFKEKDGCYFDLSTIVSPREPFAEFEWQQEAHDCENWVRFINKGHVTTITDGQLEHTAEKTQTAYWDFGDGDIIEANNPLVRVKDEGDTLTVKLLTGISDDMCMDDTTMTVIIPSIITPAITIDSVICHDVGAIIWGGQYILTSGTYYDSLKNHAGCDSVFILNATIYPKIEDTHVFDTICFGDSLVRDNRIYRTEGNYDEWYKTENGCDSLVTVHLHVRDEVVFSYTHNDVKDIPGSGSIEITDAPPQYTWYLKGPDGEGANISLTGLSGGEYELIVYDSLGCPSATEKIIIHQECLKIELDTDSLFACADESNIQISYSIISGVPTWYQLKYDSIAVKAGFVDNRIAFDGNDVQIIIPEDCKPGIYIADLIVEDEVCGDSIIELLFQIKYPSNIISQKWNDVFAIKNERYNGGYRFSAYQWYRNGAIVPNAVSPILYLGENMVFDTSDEYYVVLTREDDGVTVSSCPINPIVKQDIAVYPYQTVMQAGQSLRIMNVVEDIDVCVYDVFGRYYGVVTVDKHSPYITMPYHPGVYVIVMESDDVSCRFKIVVQ